MNKSKVFGIGLQRTGTTSLFSALNILGLKAAPHGIPLFFDINDPVLHKYDAFMDNPIPLLFKQLDQMIPGSKFILTTRDEESWLKSVEWLFTTEMPRMDKGLRSIGDQIHRAFYGTTSFDRQVMKQRRLDYLSEVDRYFQSRPKDLLKLDITQNQGWTPLCEFLDLPVPDHDFPWLNAAR